MRVLVLVLASGCSLYFGEPTPHHTTHDAGDAVDAPQALTCPKPGTYAEIPYPHDGATNVPVPVPIQTHVVIPNTLDGKGLGLTDAFGHAVSLDHWDADCSVPLQNTGQGTQDETWTDCYRDLAPDSLYTWHIWITCYDASGVHEIATSTFRTAP